MTCPKECGDRIEKLDSIVKCIPKKVSWSSFGLIAITVITIVTGYVYYVAAGDSSAEAKIAENAKQIAVIVEQVKNVQGDIKEIKDSQTEMMLQQITKEELKYIIREALKE